MKFDDIIYYGLDDESNRKIRRTYYEFQKNFSIVYMPTYVTDRI